MSPIPIDPAGAPRRARDLGRWMRWVEDQLKLRGSNRGIIERGSVGGGVTTIREILTSPASVIGVSNAEQHIVTSLGTQTFRLQYVPLEHSVQIWVAGLPQPPTEWTISGNVATIPDPDGRLKLGRVLTAYYLYEKAGATPLTVIADSGPIDWGSTGPYLLVAEGDTADYSSPAFDDSGWATAPSPVGSPLGANWGKPSWPPVVTDTGSANVGIWLRRAITVSADGNLSITIRMDGQWWLYLDGDLLDSNPAGDLSEIGPYTEAVTAGTHVIALHINDETIDPGLDDIYADMKVETA